MVIEQVVEKATGWVFLQDPALVLCCLFIATLLFFIYWQNSKLLVSLDNLARIIDKLDAHSSERASKATSEFELLKFSSEKNDNWITMTIRDLIQAVNALIKEMAILLVQEEKAGIERAEHRSKLLKLVEEIPNKIKS